MFLSGAIMPTFQYRAIQSDGTIAEGQLEASGRPDAFRQMEGRGLRPISLAERNGANGHVKSSPKAPPPAKAPAKEGTKEGTTSGPPLASLKLSLGGGNKISAR